MSEIPNSVIPGPPAFNARRVGIALGLLWLIAVVIGSAVFIGYQIRPGSHGSVARQWPPGSRIPRAPGRAILLVFLHPNCPCSKATLHSLQGVLASAANRPRTIFVLRKAMAEDWRVKDLLEDATTTPGAEFFQDGDEREIRRFGAVVSGQVLLYDRSGRLAFDGGVTDARGQDGASISGHRLLRAIDGGNGTARHAAVFGCPLQSAVEGRDRPCPAP